MQKLFHQLLNQKILIGRLRLIIVRDKAGHRRIHVIDLVDIFPVYMFRPRPRLLTSDNPCDEKHQYSQKEQTVSFLFLRIHRSRPCPPLIMQYS